jgi:hypothetical protein
MKYHKIYLFLLLFFFLFNAIAQQPEKPPVCNNYVRDKLIFLLLDSARKEKDTKMFDRYSFRFFKNEDTYYVRYFTSNKNISLSIFPKQSVNKFVRVTEIDDNCNLIWAYSQKCDTCAFENNDIDKGKDIDNASLDDFYNYKAVFDSVCSYFKIRKQ